MLYKLTCLTADGMMIHNPGAVAFQYVTTDAGPWCTIVLSANLCDTTALFACKFMCFDQKDSVDFVWTQTNTALTGVTLLKFDESKQNLLWMTSTSGPVSVIVEYDHSALVPIPSTNYWSILFIPR